MTASLPALTVLSALLAAAAVLAWPWGTGPRRSAGHPAGDPPAATVYDVADAATLLGLVLRAGLGPVEALETVATQVGGPVGLELSVVAAAHRWGEGPESAWSHVGPVWRQVGLSWRAAVEAGAAPAGLIEAAAGRMRDDEDRRIEAAVERAGVMLVLPLGLAFLPGFVGTTIIPVVLHLVGSLVG